ncbi:MAG: ribosomal-processing cysteine protease Prp [Bacillota bacterium]
MLKIRLLRSPGSAGEEVLSGFAVEGHAGFGDYGKDIVCAGVSAVAQTALFGLQDILGGAVRSEMKGGYLEVQVDCLRAREEGPRAVLRALELGLRAMERSYPGAMEICDEERSGTACC